jgi:hypothetical protein
MSEDQNKRRAAPSKKKQSTGQGQTSTPVLSSDAHAMSSIVHEDFNECGYLHLPIQTNDIVSGMSIDVHLSMSRQDRRNQVPSGYEDQDAESFLFIQSDKQVSDFVEATLQSTVELDNQIYHLGNKMTGTISIPESLDNLPRPSSTFFKYPVKDNVRNIEPILTLDHENGHGHNGHANSDSGNNAKTPNANATSSKSPFAQRVARHHHIKTANSVALNSENTFPSVIACQSDLITGPQTNGLPQSTSIHCFWDCHPFVGQPVGLPLELRNDVAIVSRVFCSPECVAAYNFRDTTCSKDQQWERFALLNTIYRPTREDSSSRATGIRLALPRESLIMFGGPFTIQQFRHLSTSYRYSIYLSYYPLSFVTPTQEIASIDIGYSSAESSDITEKPKSSKLRLFRKKPLYTDTRLLETVRQTK